MHTRDTIFSSRELVFRKPEETAHWCSAKLNKKGNMFFLFANVLAIIAMIIIAFIGWSQIDNSVKDSYIKKGIAYDESIVLNELLRHDKIDGFSGDFADYVLDANNKKDFKGVEKVVENFLGTYDSYKFYIRSSIVGTEPFVYLEKNIAGKGAGTSRNVKIAVYDKEKMNFLEIGLGLLR